MSYAKGTTVSTDRSRAEIERTLMKYGADRFGYMNERTKATIVFEFRSVSIKMDIPLPDLESKRFQETSQGKQRHPDVAFRDWEQETKRRWRSLALAIKSKMIMVEDEVTTFEREFLPYVVMPDGRTLGDIIGPAIVKATASGKGMPSVQKLLTGGHE